MRSLARLQGSGLHWRLGVVGTLWLALGWALQEQQGSRRLARELPPGPARGGREGSLRVPQTRVNATLGQDVLLSVAYNCERAPVIEWKHTSSKGTTKVAEWKPGTYTNISSSYEERVNVYENGSLQLLKVDLGDSGYYLVTVRDEFRITIYGTILLNVYEILYEDLHFVAVFFAFLTAVSALLICLLWLCNKSVHLLQSKRSQLKASDTEETELQVMDC